MESNSSVNVTGVQLPSYPMVSNDLFRRIELAAMAVPSSTEEFGEYFAMSLIQMEPAELVLPDVVCSWRLLHTRFPSTHTPVPSRPTGKRTVAVM